MLGSPTSKHRSFILFSEEVVDDTEVENQYDEGEQDEGEQDENEEQQQESDQKEHFSEQDDNNEYLDSQKQSGIYDKFII